MITDALDSFAAELRRAVAAEQFECVPALVAGYVAVLEDTARRLDPSTPDFTRLEHGAHELIGWARERAIAARAHTAARLSELVTARSYLPVSDPGHVTETLG